METFKKLNLWWQCFVVCVIGQIADIVSSMGITPDDVFYEHNPFIRYNNGQFNAARGVVLKGYFIAEYSLFSWLIWLATPYLPRQFRLMLSVLPLLYLAYIGFDAAWSNGLVHFHWYQPIDQENLFSFFK